MQEVFCQQYVIHRQGKKAAIEAKYSKKTADQKASHLLKLPHIKARIAELEKPALKKAKVNVDRVMQELARLGFYDPAVMFDDDNNLLAIKDMPPEIRAAISGIDVFEEYQGKGKNRQFIGYTKKIRFCNKTKALELLGKTNTFNMFVENIKTTIEETPATKEAFEKARKDLVKDITKALKK